MVFSGKSQQTMSTSTYVAERRGYGFRVRCEVSSDMDGLISLVKIELGVTNF